jgi:hypothetical protein
MKVYQTSKMDNESYIISEDKLPKSTLGYDFNIKSASAFPPTKERESVLVMILKDLSNKGVFYDYKLFGTDIKKEFLEDMKVKYPHELIGKAITGYLSNRRIGLQGIGVEEK